MAVGIATASSSTAATARRPVERSADGMRVRECNEDKEYVAWVECGAEEMEKGCRARSETDGMLMYTCDPAANCRPGVRRHIAVT